MITELQVKLLQACMLPSCYGSQNVTLHLVFLIYPSFLHFLRTYVAFLVSSRSNETSGGAEEARGAPQPGAAETKADRDEVCVLMSKLLGERDVVN